MFRELVELGRDLERQEKLPPPGFYEYKEPIRWIVHLWPDRVHLEQGSDQRVARPFGGRTSAVEEHLLTDEAAYALGVNRVPDAPADKRAADKHEHFRTLLDAFQASSSLQDDDLRDTLGWLVSALDEDWVSHDERFNQIASKDWVSFVPGQGALAGSHLFQHPDAKSFWLSEMQRRCATEGGSGRQQAVGACSVCGRDHQLLIRKLPLGVKLVGNTPLHSLNADAFTSFIGGAATSKRAHLGLCFECGDTASRAFNFLSNSGQHRRVLYRDSRKRDSLANQIALFWLKAPAPVTVGDNNMELDLNDLAIIDFGAVLNDRLQAPPAALSQLDDLVKLPWAPRNSALRLDEYGFFLAILSPNVGRIAVRDWIAVSLGALKESLSAFLKGARVVSPWGDAPRPIAIAAILEALGDDAADLTRALLRSAYTGTKPPVALATQAGQRLGSLLVNESTLRQRQQSRGRDQGRVWDDGWLHALAAAIKLGLYHGTEEATTMTDANPVLQSTAYHCGRLLALLEEAQQIYNYHQYGDRLETTIVNRGYGGASSTPKASFAPLFRLASTAHLPEAGGWINKEVEKIVVKLVELGGMPEILPLPAQAEFGLGFYHQRALIRGRPRPAKSVPEQQGDADDAVAQDGITDDVDAG